MMIGNVVFLRRTTEAGAVELTPGLVVDYKAPQVTVEFQDVVLLLSGAQVGICYKRNEKLYGLPVKVTVVMKARPRTVVRFEIEGEAEVVEGRSALRVLTTVDDIAIDTGDAAPGRLIDVSGDGLAVVLNAWHRMGEYVTVRFEFRGETFSGRVVVCNVRSLGGSRFRYGLKPAPREALLVRGLQTVAATLQRERRQREVEKRAG